MSTFAAGTERDLLRFTSELIALASEDKRHVSATVHLSRGCPGEVVCELPRGAGPLAAEIPEVQATGIHAVAEWALYPLDDGGLPGSIPDHMRDIYAAIDFARANGTFENSEHFVTRLSGDVAAVLQTVFAGWVLVGRTVQHVTSHVILSINSPSAL